MNEPRPISQIIKKPENHLNDRSIQKNEVDQPGNIQMKKKSYNPYSDRQIPKGRYKLVIWWKPEFLRNPEKPSRYFHGNNATRELNIHPKIRMGLHEFCEESELKALIFKLNHLRPRAALCIIYDLNATQGEEEYARWEYGKEIFYRNY